MRNALVHRNSGWTWCRWCNPAGPVFEDVFEMKTLALLLILLTSSAAAQERLKYQFTATAIDGTKVSVPQSYKGKILLVQFWATYCQPCREEIPNIMKAWSDNKDGFDIVGISLDRDGSAKVLEFADRRNMAWPQLYNSNLDKLFGVTEIPHLLLVDGDSGEILAKTNQLRGPGMSAVVARELARKRGRQ